MPLIVQNRLRVLAAASVAAPLVACAGPRLSRFEYEAPAMGTVFRVVLYAEERAVADAAAEGAFARVSELDDAFSDYDPESELSRLSRLSDGDGGSAGRVVSDPLFEVLRLAGEVARETEGAFDVTVGPYVRLWRRARRQGRLPDAALLEEASTSVGYEKLSLDPRTREVRLLAPSMRLDLGGIAKGYAADRALEVLRRRGVDRALVDAGGDVVVGRSPPGRRGWRVALAPLEEGNAPTAIEVEHAAVATSGDLARFVEVDGVRYSHVVDPRTGRAVSERRLVTVVARRGWMADALASAVSVLGHERASELARGFPGTGIRVLLPGAPGEREARLCVTAGFPVEISSARPDGRPDE